MKKILVLGIIFILIGGVFCGAAYAAGEKYVDKKTTDITAEFSASGVDKINVGAHIGTIRIVQSQNSGEILVVAENIAENEFECESSGGTLYVAYNPKTVKFGFISLPAFVGEPFWGKKNPAITIYIPKDKLFDEIYFEGGVGDTKIEQISAKSFVLSGGVGNFEVQNIYAEGFLIKGGVGDFKIGGTILGDIEIDGGLGNIRLDLKGDADDYGVKSKSGLGNIKIGGRPPMDEGRSSTIETSTSGKYKININGGVGNIDINFSE